jgi:hypothetical protein
MGKPNELTLANIGGGGLAEDVSRELRRVCENIADPNCKTDAKRSIKIDLKIKPDAKGQTAVVTYEVKTTMPGPEPGSSTAWIAMHENKMGLFQMDLRQNELPFNPDPTVSTITPVAEKSKTARMPAPQVTKGAQLD